MSPFAIAVVGLAMSTDAFAAAVGRGVGMRAPGLGAALRVGLIFATVETLTPALGWLLGRAAAGVVEGWDHWIALALLAGLGIHMIAAGLKPEDESDAPSPSRDSLWFTAVAAVATSIDALAAGIGLAFLDVSIVAVALTIGLCTFVMVTLGILLGARFGGLLGKRAEIVGGFVMIAVGVGIVYQHTTA